MADASSLLRALKRTIKRRFRDAYLTRRRIAFRNREGHREFDFVLHPRRKRQGISAMIRAKNESAKIVNCISSILPVFEQIVFIDNGSTDDTRNLVLQLKAHADSSNKIRVLDYPFSIARCGKEHFDCPEDSIHSLVYYYNWCLSHCTCTYMFKWDADMVLKRDRVETFRREVGRCVSGGSRIWLFPIQTLYRTRQGRYYAAMREVNLEARLSPNNPAVRYQKANDWEILRSDVDLDRASFPETCIYELKDVAEDEFDHWSNTEFTTARKHLEWENFQRVSRGDLAETSFAAVPLADVEG